MLFFKPAPRFKSVYPNKLGHLFKIVYPISSRATEEAIDIKTINNKE